MSQEFDCHYGEAAPKKDLAYLTIHDDSQMWKG